MSTFSTEKKLVEKIKKRVRKGNVDNISRTEFYCDFYRKHTEIRWALLASAVSRNAGWSMTDLKSNWYKRMIPNKLRDNLFMTYERANWLIFEDAYPQLLVYEASKLCKVPLFHLLEEFHVSSFMRHEWERFWEFPEIERLCTALIINEQNLIQKPVIEHPFYDQKVFHTLPFFLEDFFHYSAVLFPTCKGELFGCSVTNFLEVKERIQLGKRLAWILFCSEEKERVHTFLKKVAHTGSRNDYQRYLGWKTTKSSPMLRMSYPVILHHRGDVSDWSLTVDRKKLNGYFEEIKSVEQYNLTDWFKHKQFELYVSMRIEEFLLPAKLVEERYT